MAFDKARALNLARKYISRGAYRAAVAEYRAVHRNDPRSTHFLVKIAELYEQLASPKEAVEAYVEAARAYVVSGLSQRAASAYQEAVRVAPNEAHLRDELAALCVKTGDRTAAAEHYDAAVKAYMRKGMPRPAIDAMERRLALDADDVRVRLRLAGMLADDGQVARASEHYQAALDRLRKSGAKSAFIGVAARWLKLAPDNYELRLELATVHLDNSDAYRSLEHLRVCYRERPYDSEMLGVLARTLTELGCEQRAARVLERRARLVPVERPGTHRRMAYGSQRQDAVVVMPPQSRKPRAPTEADKLYREASAFMKLGLAVQAMPLLRKALESEPHHQRARAALIALERSVKS